MSQPLVTPAIIYATAEAHECYDLLCGTRQVEDPELKKKQIRIFSDTVQAFYCAAVIGHNLQQGTRYIVKDKATKRKGLLQRQQWERKEKSDLRKALTFLVNLEYGVSEGDEVLQVVTELAEAGIRHIRKKVFENGDFDWNSILDQLRKRDES